MTPSDPHHTAESSFKAGTVSLFLCGDVMTGRGIDQILPHPSDPIIYERYTRSALDYVALAERVNGRIPRRVDFAYIWGDALAELEARAPDWRMVNLETSITTSDEPEMKGINYRMHPSNVPCLSVANIHCCGLANNHVLDWGVAGLLDTLKILRVAGAATPGAGNDADEAARPAVLSAPGKGKVLVFAFASPTSGVPLSWAATGDRAGVNLLRDFSEESADRIAAQIGRHRRPGDVVVASIHWGGNWGYDIPREHRAFAHRLIDSGSVDVIHGHSSHHPMGIEHYRGRPILYGCGDFINDYEGISGHEEFRSELVLAYFVTLDAASGRLVRLAMVPFRPVRFRLQRATRSETEWLEQLLDREGEALSTSAELAADGSLALRW